MSLSLLLVQGPRRLLALSALVAGGLSIVRIPVFWANEAYLGNAAGVWTALAVDMSHGIGHRAAFAPDGYGGVNYPPVHVAFHAAIIGLTGDPVLSGHIVAAASVALLILGTYLLLRALGAGRGLALSSAAAILASQATQMTLLSIRADALAAAFNILGLAVVAAPSAGLVSVVIAAVLFALGVATKPTAVYGLTAACVWLVLSGRRATATALAAVTATAGLLVVYLWIGGSAFQTTFLGGAVAFAGMVRDTPETLVFVQLACAAVVVLIMRRRSLSSIPVALFLSVLLTSSAGTAMEGAETARLVDIHVAAVVALAAFVISTGDTGLGVLALAVATLAASTSLVTGLANRDQVQRRGTFGEALALVPDRGQPILAENPLVPIAAGQRPYMVDAALFRQAVESDPAFGEPLRRALDRQEFSAVVLERDPHDARGQDWYRNAVFGRDFVEVVERSYDVVGRVGARVVYAPKED